METTEPIAALEAAALEQLKRHGLVQPGDRVIAAVSGGADSMALLLFFLRCGPALGLTVEVAHVDHGLRGEASARDAAFVAAFCRARGVPLHRFSAPEEGVVPPEGAGEAWARQLRYGFFERLCREHGAKLATAHTKNDQAETLLLNLLRGTGIRGLAAMHPRNGHVARPLLCVGHADILAYLKDRQQPYVTDSTNLVPDTRRNYIRLHIMPLLRQLHATAPQAMAHTASLVQEALPCYLTGVKERMKQAGFAGNRLETEPFLQAGAPPLLLHEWLAPCGFNATTVDDIARHIPCRPGTQWMSGTHRVVADRGCLLLRPLHEQPKAPCLRMHTVEAIGATGPRVAYFDADLITQPLHTRLARKGDWFVPFGMKGRKLLSDFLTDSKAGADEKAAQYVVCHGNDIIWVVGRRSDNRYRVTPSTRRILRLELTDEEQGTSM